MKGVIFSSGSFSVLFISVADMTANLRLPEGRARLSDQVTSGKGRCFADIRAQDDLFLTGELRSSSGG